MLEWWNDVPIFQSSSIPVFQPCNIPFLHSPLSPFAPVKLNFLSLVPRPSTLSVHRPSSVFLLPRHRDLYPLFRTDEVIVVVFAEIDLHPVNLAADDAA